MNSKKERFGIVYDRASVWPNTLVMIDDQVRRLCQEQGIPPNDVTVISMPELQQIRNAWGEARWLEINSRAESPGVASRVITEAKGTGAFVGLWLFSFLSPTLAVASPSDNFVRAKNLNQFDPARSPGGGLRTGYIARRERAENPGVWRYPAIAGEEQVAQDVLAVIRRKELLSPGKAIMASDIRALLENYHSRWNVDKLATPGLVQSALAVVERRGLIRQDNSRSLANPRVELTLAGIAEQQTDLSSVAQPSNIHNKSAAASPDQAVESAGGPQTIAASANSAQPTKVEDEDGPGAKQRERSEMEVICRRGGWGPFSSVRLEFYAAMSDLATPQNPQTLAALAHAAVTPAGELVRKKFEGVECDGLNGSGRRMWPEVIKFVLKILPRAEVAVNGNEVIKQGWGAVAAPVTGFIDDWMEHTDGVIVCAIVAALGELPESRFEELAGILHNRRDSAALVRTSKIIELLCEKTKRLEKGLTADGDLVLRLPKAESPLRLRPCEVPAEPRPGTAEPEASAMPR